MRDLDEIDRAVGDRDMAPEPAADAKMTFSIILPAINETGALRETEPHRSDKSQECVGIPDRPLSRNYGRLPDYRGVAGRGTVAARAHNRTIAPFGGGGRSATLSKPRRGAQHGRVPKHVHA